MSLLHLPENHRCISCKKCWPEVAFPHPKALLCNWCTPTTVDQNIGRTDKFTSNVEVVSDGKHPPWLEPRLVKGAKKPINLNLQTQEQPLFGAADNRPPSDRPLIDSLHEATFTDSECLDFIKDRYAFRMLVRKAHCFTLDKDTSRLAADFSIAIKPDLEAARRLAVPPFPVTWIEMDCRARQTRAHELGIKFASESPIEHVAPRVGWLIFPGDLGGYYILHVMDDVRGPLAFPLAFWWHNGEPYPRDPRHEVDTILQALAFGFNNPNVSVNDCFAHPSPMHVNHNKPDNAGIGKVIGEMMAEISGELRYVWGVLIALGAGHLGAEVSTSEAQRHQGPQVKIKDKTVLPLEHKILTIKLGKRLTVPKLVARAITHHKNRLHEVRGHWRAYKNDDGTVRKRVPVKSHKRGDERLGRIEKTYRVER